MYRINTDVQEMIDQIITGYMVHSMRIDRDREVVARCCEALLKWIGHVGAAAVHKHLDLVSKTLTLIFQVRVSQ